MSEFINIEDIDGKLGFADNYLENTTEEILKRNKSDHTVVWITPRDYEILSLTCQDLIEAVRVLTQHVLLLEDQKK